MTDEERAIDVAAATPRVNAILHPNGAAITNVAPYEAPQTAPKPPRPRGVTRALTGRRGRPSPIRPGSCRGSRWMNLRSGVGPCRKPRQHILPRIRRILTILRKSPPRAKTRVGSTRRLIGKSIYVFERNGTGPVQDGGGRMRPYYEHAGISGVCRPVVNLRPRDGAVSRR